MRHQRGLVAVGAAIKGSPLVAEDSIPESSLRVTASMIPFIQHNDPARALMAANMLRQSLVLPTAEPALVQTGREPAAAGVWAGRNLLTAFTSSGGGTFGDGIVISEPAAKKLRHDRPIEVGDRLGNRHGAKGVISSILPDSAMPSLMDGTSVELLFCFIGLHTRLNYGQLREAALSRVAMVDGEPRVSAYNLMAEFFPPGIEDLQDRLRAVGISVEVIEGENLQFGETAPQGETLRLAAPLPHPWRPGREVAEVGVVADVDYADLETANAKLMRMVQTQAPPALLSRGKDETASKLHRVFEKIVSGEAPRITGRTVSSSAAMLVPDLSLRYDQVSLPLSIARRWFGLEDSVQSLREKISGLWVVVCREPAIEPTSLLAFRPVLSETNAIGLSPMICAWLQADFDGDQATVTLPQTQGGQEDARTKLSVLAHVKRDAELLEGLLPAQESLWGLASRSQSDQGRQEIGHFQWRLRCSLVVFRLRRFAE